MDSQAALAVADHVQSAGGAVRATLPIVAELEGLTEDGVIEYVHATPLCVIVNGCPARVSVPFREAEFGLAATP
jgi:hypothetical protein